MQTTPLVKLTIVFSIMMLVACAPMVSPLITVSATPVQLDQPPIEIRYGWIARWLNQTVCAPPCWEGIVPGGTLLKEAIVLIEEIPDTKITGEWEQVVEWEMAGSDYGMALTNLKLGMPGNGSIVWITINVNKNQSVSLEEVIDVFGFPSYVQVVSCAEEGSSCDTNLIYSDVGMVLNLYLEKDHEGNVDVKGHSTIVGLMFFVPGIENYMEVSPHRFSSLKSWEGFGLYSP